MTVIRDMVGGLSRTPLAAEEDVRPWEKTRWNASTMRPATMTMAAGRHRRSRLATVRYRVGKGTSAASQNASAFGMSTRKMADQAVGDIAQDEDTAARDRGEDAAARDHPDRHGEIDHDRHGAGGAGTGSGEPATRRAATRRLALWCSELAGRPGGYPTAWKAANTIKATTMARTGCQSIPRALLSVIEGGVFVDRLARSTS